MRVSKPVELDRISQALARSGCPICAFLKNEQAALLRGRLAPDRVSSLCNFHAWALAAAIESDNAARIFLQVLRQVGNRESSSQCSFCARLLEQEVTQLKDLIAQMNRRLVANWMKEQGILCRLHAEHLRQLAPLKLHAMIDEIIERSRHELEAELENLLRRAAAGERAGGGVLGRAAEFLTSQRGVNH
jgi:hypothetical protein